MYDDVFILNNISTNCQGYITIRNIIYFIVQINVSYDDNECDTFTLHTFPHYLELFDRNYHTFFPKIFLTAITNYRVNPLKVFSISQGCLQLYILLSCVRNAQGMQIQSVTTKDDTHPSHEIHTDNTKSAMQAQI